MIHKLLAILGSYGLACILLGVLLLLTLFGTIEQTEIGLAATLDRYFGLFFTVQPFGIPILVPGANLVMALLLVNIVVGSILRLRWCWSRIGVLISHFGIVFLFISGFVTMFAEDRGQFFAWEGQSSREVQSTESWEVAIARSPARVGAREYLIPEGDFAHDGSTRFQHVDLPFDLQLGSYIENARPRIKQTADIVDLPVVEGIYFASEERRGDRIAVLPGLHARLRETASGREQSGLLWGGEEAPWSVQVGSEVWTVALRRKLMTLPFALSLEEFTVEFYPRTRKPSAYISDVTKLEGGNSQKIRIEMNRPLRSKGYTFYQSDWGPKENPKAARQYTILTVTNNPYEIWPEIATYIITLGLLIHFGYRLYLHLIRENERRSQP